MNDERSGSVAVSKKEFDRLDAEASNQHPNKTAFILIRLLKLIP